MKERLVTPVGEAKWASVHTPRPEREFLDKRGKTIKRPSKYEITLVFDVNDPEWKDWASDIKARALANGKNVPIKPELDGEKKPTGKYQAVFHSSPEYKPRVVMNGGPLDPNVLIGNGSKVRVNCTPEPYDGFGGGVTLYLNAVQVVELIEYQAKSDFDEMPAALVESEDDSALPF